MINIYIYIELFIDKVYHNLADNNIKKKLLYLMFFLLPNHLGYIEKNNIDNILLRAQK